MGDGGTGAVFERRVRRCLAGQKKRIDTFEKQVADLQKEVRVLKDAQPQRPLARRSSRRSAVKPELSPSAFCLHVRSMRHELEGSAAAKAKMASSRWKELSADMKAPFEREAAESRAARLEAMR
jgi:hypothetical protein